MNYCACSNVESFLRHLCDVTVQNVWKICLQVVVCSLTNVSINSVVIISSIQIVNSPHLKDLFSFKRHLLDSYNMIDKATLHLNLPFLYISWHTFIYPVFLIMVVVLTIKDKKNYAAL